MPRMDYDAFTEYFTTEVLPLIAQHYEQDGIPDRPARREAWNDTVDAMGQARQLESGWGDWDGIPDHLEEAHVCPTRKEYGWIWL